MAETSKHGRPLRVGRSDAAEEEMLAKDLAKVERELNKSQREIENEKEIAALRQQLSLERGKMAEYERLHKKWVLGDYSDLPGDHPFELTIFTNEDPRRNHAVQVFINGVEYKIPRGVSVRVPHVVVQNLSQTRIQGMQRIPDKYGNVVDVPVLDSRFQFNARPIYNPN